ncbi:MAG: NAD-dependent epimerase/dehydratase family protein [Candidatus Micrarchaeota archaeon]|nr:NAD-dependent epimerase/dehydratase family protein [Candidatus Micrarchaeota archaeon]
MATTIKVIFMPNVLVIGAVGQIGTELTMELRRRYGGQKVVAATRKTPFPKELEQSGPCIFFDVADKEAMKKVITEHKIDTIYQLASLLSATGEKDPDLAFQINLIGLKNTLDVARECGVKRIFWPSSIAAFGPTTPRDNTPQRTVLEPTTMYGVTKVAGELLCQYYSKKYGMDIRSVRYPGLISYKAEPGGGTTDYSVAIFYEAIKHKKYTCFVGPETVLPMMYMPDAIRGTIALMEAPREKLTVHTSYNLAAISFSAKELAAEVARLMPGFTCDYKPDHRQAIADSWPKSIDDSQARQDWGWKHEYGLTRMSEDMIKNLTPILQNKK